VGVGMGGKGFGSEVVRGGWWMDGLDFFSRSAWTWHLDGIIICIS
jgi:hypothetical protein